MESTPTECPNCQAKLKSGMFNFVVLLDQSKTDFINAVENKDSPGYCNKCGDALLSQAASKVASEKQSIREHIFKLLNYIPVISAQNPLNWEYDVLTMVTGQSTTGTGIFSEFVSSWTDLFGAQSGSFNKKLKQGELLCFAQLRKQTIDMGGNAVIATDIDYSEVGGDKGMLMVCMAGTAVRLKNPDVLGERREEKFRELAELNNRLKKLTELTANS